MAFSSTIKATLGLGIDKFTSGLRQAGDQLDKFSGETKKKFSTGGLFKGLLASFALDAQSIAETLASAIMGGAEEGFNRAKEAADSFNDYLDQRIRGQLSGKRLVESLNQAAEIAQRDAQAPRRRFGDRAPLWVQSWLMQSGSMLRAYAEAKAWGGSENEAAFEERQMKFREKSRRLADEARDVQKKMAEDEEKTVMEIAKAQIKQEDDAARAQAEALKKEQQITEEKEKQAEVQKKSADARLRDLAQAIAAQREARQAVADALSDQSAASLSEITGGTRGSRADRARAAEVERLRSLARAARDAGRTSLIGGEAVSVADQLSTRANDVQRGIRSLNTAERDPLASVTARLDQANAELAAIKLSLEVMEIED